MKRILIPIIIFMVVFGFALACGGSGSSVEKKGHSEVEAWTAAQLEVERNLKSPSSAKFPWVKSEDVVNKINDDTFKVKSYVDSENSFGAMVRTNFSCTVEFTGEDTYIVKDLEFWK
jgi:hypothetical protein